MLSFPRHDRVLRSRSPDSRPADEAGRGLPEAEDFVAFGGRIQGLGPRLPYEGHVRDPVSAATAVEPGWTPVRA